MERMTESEINDDRDRREVGIYEVNFGYDPVTVLYAKSVSQDKENPAWPSVNNLI